jgi:flagellar hook-associated protein 2
MGAVGLNFGSPTSGQGFDVTSTVNQIVTNLQSVEKPWKDQLTALQSKDTVLSSLGTQLSTLTSDLQALTDFNGTMAYKTGSSSNTDVLHLSSASANAVAGTHTVVVQNLAQVSTAATDAIKSKDVLTGGITFKIGDGAWKTVNLGDASTEATIAGLSAAINSASLGVTASVLTNADGTARLSLVSKTDGTAGQITIANSANNPASPTNISDKTTPDANANLGFTVIQNGIDATMKVDGVTLTSASNTVTNAIPGVTFQLLSTGTSDTNSTPPSIQVVIDNDTSSVETAIAKFVTDYNATIKAINTQEGKDSSGKPEPLYGTGVAAQIQEGLLTAISASFGSNVINSLIALGIKATPAADGTITLDADRLTSALNGKFDQVVSLFQDSGSFGSAFMETLERLGTSSAAGGAIALALNENSSQEETLNDNIERQEAVITTQKARLTSELSLANQILQAIPQQINQVNEMYSAITGYNRNQNG